MSLWVKFSAFSQELVSEITLWQKNVDLTAGNSMTHHSSFPQVLTPQDIDIILQYFLLQPDAVTIAVN